MKTQKMNFFVSITILVVFLSAFGCSTSNKGGSKVEIPSGGIEGNGAGGDGGSDVCEVGDEGCLCVNDEQCSEGRACANFLCKNCEETQAGCPCVNNGCDGEFECEGETNTCQYPSVCVEFGCVPNQFCSGDRDDAIECAEERCEPGFVWNVESGQCDEIEGSNCDAGAELSISDACFELRRGCEEEGNAARCGDCFARTRSRGSECVEFTRCSDLNCGRNRSCIDAEENEDAYCGDCEDGFSENADGDCVAAGDVCAECSGENRSCMEGEQALCGDCLPGYMEDETQSCVIEHETCEEAMCAPGQICEDQGQNAPAICLASCEGDLIWDARMNECRALVSSCLEACGEEAEGCEVPGQDALCSCPDNQGIDIVNPGNCAPCDNVVCAASDQLNQTGRKILVGENECICEPKPGYFVGAAGIKECDADGDGWFNSEATSANAFGAPADSPYLLLAKRNCLLRRIENIVIRSEAYLSGARNQPESGNWVEKRIRPTGGELEMYELPAYDDVNSNQGNMQAELQLFSPQHINSLTKACVSKTGDFNGNKIPDYREWEDEPLASAQELDYPETTRNYLLRYLKYSYFLELHDGWFEPRDVVGGYLVGDYIIQERSRNAMASSKVPVTYPENDTESPDQMEGQGPVSEWFRLDPGLPGEEVPSTTRHQYWQECNRYTDRLYQEDGGFENPVNRAGGDFTSEHFLPSGEDRQPLSNEAIMRHHSQFKCVLLESEDAYNSQENAPEHNLTNTPYAVYRDDDDNGQKELHRKNEGPRMQEGTNGHDGNRWYLNNCRVNNGGISVADAYGDIAPNPIDDAGAENAHLVNPLYPLIHCLASPNNIAFPSMDMENPDQIELVETNDIEGKVYWASVGYDHYSLVGKDYVEPGEDGGAGSHGIHYIRGCINECAEYSVNACFDGEVMSEVDVPRFTCDHEHQFHFGVLTCGCGENYGHPEFEGGEPCSYGCPNLELMKNSTFDIASRAGTWMCGRVENGSSVPMAQAFDDEDRPIGYSIRGSIPSSGTDGTAMSGESNGVTYTLRSR